MCARRLLGHLLLGLCAPLAAVAADEGRASFPAGLPHVDGFPSQPIRLIVYTSPGGLIDVTARRFARLAQEYAGHPFAVINRPGGGGIVAFEEAVREPADGHRFLAVTRSNVSKLVATGREDLIDRIHWHSSIMDNPHVLITNIAEGPPDWTSLHALGRRVGRDQLWLGVDIGGVKHVSGVKIAEKAGVSMRWIPYGSGGEAVAALLGNLGAAYLGNPRDALASEKLRVVAVAAEERLPDFPEAPTFAELGVAGLENELIWRGFAFRKGVPGEIQEWYSALIQLVLNNPRWVSAWQGEAVNLRFRDAESFQAVVERDRAEFRTYLERLGLLRADEDREGAVAGLARPPGLYWLIGAAGGLLLGLALALRYTRRRHAAGELVLLAGIATVSLVALLMTLHLPRPNPLDPVGATGIPRIWLLLLLPLTIWQIARVGGRPREPEALQFGRFLVTLGAFAGYLALVPVLGFLVASLIYMPALIWFLGYRRVVVIAVVTVGWLAFSLVVFQRLLHVELPRGVWFV